MQVINQPMTTILFTFFLGGCRGFAIAVDLNADVEVFQIVIVFGFSNRYCFWVFKLLLFLDFQIVIVFGSRRSEQSWPHNSVQHALAPTPRAALQTRCS